MILKGEEARAFMHSMIHPDEEAMKKRDMFLKRCDELVIQHLDDGSVIIDCPDIVMDFNEINIDNTKLI